MDSLSLDEVEKMHTKYVNKDPFPNILPALLNSADISDYIEATGMLFPFRKEDLKPATIALRILGKIVYWDEGHTKKVIYLRDKDTFKLRRNSIAYVTLEPYIQLPNYIAARFNLKIDNVYKGLLLGTGPIVDPGFCGKLSIPLHNLTNNDYKFKGGDKLIWMEFTKLSNYKDWENSQEEKPRNGNFKVYDSSKNKDSDVETYIQEANDGDSVESSLTSIVTKIEYANKKIRDISKFTNVISFSSMIAVMLGIMTSAGYFIIEMDKKNGQIKNLIEENKEQRKTLIQSQKADSMLVVNLRNEILMLRKEVDKLKFSKM